MDDVEEYREAFSLFDKRGDGKIESGEIGTVLRALGLNPTMSDEKKILADIDPKGEKRVSFDEFVPIYLHAQKNKTARKQGFEHFVEGFKIFDRDGNGLVSAAEIRHILTSLGDVLSDQEVGELLSGMEDNMGKVNYEEFIRNVMSG